MHTTLNAIQILTMQNAIDRVDLERVTNCKCLSHLSADTCLNYCICLIRLLLFVAIILSRLLLFGGSLCHSELLLPNLNQTANLNDK